MTRTFECPKCGTRRTERFAKAVFHNCPVGKQEIPFDEIKDENDDK